MAEYLLDTHAVLWYLENSENLSAKARNIILDMNQSIYVSSLSYWELTIKSGLKKLKLPDTILRFIERAESFQLQTIGIKPEYLTILHDLPLHHRDPFDRLLIATAIAENIPIISRDGLLDSYDIVRIW